MYIKAMNEEALNWDAIRKKIKKLSEEHNISIRQLCIQSKVAYPNISRFLNKQREGISIDILYKLAKTLDVPIGYFFGEVDLKELKTTKAPEVVIHYGSAETIKDQINTQDFAFIPLMQSKAAASPEVIDIATDNVEGWACIHTSKMPKTAGNLFAFKVVGESMLPELRPGDIVAINRYEIPPNFDSVSIKSTYLVRIDDGYNNYGLSLKHVEVVDNRYIILVSDNPKFKPKLIDLKEHRDFAILGKVVWMWREFKEDNA